MFADGVGAAVFTSARHHHRDPHKGLLFVRYETSPDVELVTYPAGGCLHRTSAGNLADHVFLMDAVKVAEVFPPLMTRNFDMLRQDWPTTIKPTTGTDFDIGQVTRWYLHQANGVVIRQAVDMLGLPAGQVPISVGHYGNTSTASTLILLDEDRRGGKVHDGDLIRLLVGRRRQRRHERLRRDAAVNRRRAIARAGCGRRTTTRDMIQGTRPLTHVIRPALQATPRAPCRAPGVGQRVLMPRLADAHRVGRLRVRACVLMTPGLGPPRLARPIVRRAGCGTGIRPGMGFACRGEPALAGPARSPGRGRPGRHRWRAGQYLAGRRHPPPS
jgi:hypothetical protein